MVWNELWKASNSQEQKTWTTHGDSSWDLAYSCRWKLLSFEVWPSLPCPHVLLALSALSYHLNKRGMTWLIFWGEVNVSPLFTQILYLLGMRMQQAPASQRVSSPLLPPCFRYVTVRVVGNPLVAAHHQALYIGHLEAQPGRGWNETISKVFGGHVFVPRPKT